MTLIVARKLGETAWIVGDSMYSGGPQNLRQANLGLKILALDQDTFISYSGSPDIAHGILGSVAAKCCGKCLDTILDVLVTELEKSGAQLDFIVVRRGQISVVKDCNLMTNQSAAWIGDHAAFAAFQKYLGLIESDQDTPLSDSLDRSGGPQAVAQLSILNVETICGAVEADIQRGRKLHEAMQLVIGDLSIQSVDGQATVAVSGKCTSRYLLFNGATSPVYEPKEEGWQTIDFGGAADGGYIFTTITPAEAGISGWGIFYHQAQFGRYFVADLGLQNFVVFESRGENAEAFCKCLAEELDYKPTHCGSWGSSASKA